MSRFTLYRADVDSARLARVLGKVPGVAVADDETDQAPADETTTATDDESAAWTERDDDDGGLRERVPDADIGGGEESVVKTYGLLGLGVSMVMLGFATVGIWVYLRRKGDGEESETPPPTTGVDTSGATPTPSTATPSPSSETTPSTADLSTERLDEGDDEAAQKRAADEDQPHGRTEGDRTDVEWSTRDTTPGAPAAADESAELTAEADEGSDDDPRPTGSVDAAPLLGAAFLALSGAVVKWLQSGDET